MAIDRNGLFVDTQVAWHTGAISIDWNSASAGTFKGALWNGSGVTVNFSQSSPAYGSAPWNAGEASGPGYTAGGLAIANPTFAEVGSDGKTAWSWDALAWTETTIEADALLIYIPGLSNRALMLRYFGQAYPTQDGDFTVTPHATNGALLRAHLGPAA